MLELAHKHSNHNILSRQEILRRTLKTLQGHSQLMPTCDVYVRQRLPKCTLQNSEIDSNISHIPIYYGLNSSWEYFSSQPWSVCYCPQPCYCPYEATYHCIQKTIHLLKFTAILQVGWRMGAVVITEVPVEVQINPHRHKGLKAIGNSFENLLKWIHFINVKWNAGWNLLRHLYELHLKCSGCRIQNHNADVFLFPRNLIVCKYSWGIKSKTLLLFSINSTIQLFSQVACFGQGTKTKIADWVLVV